MVCVSAGVQFRLPGRCNVTLRLPLPQILPQVGPGLASPSLMPPLAGPSARCWPPVMAAMTSLCWAATRRHGRTCTASTWSRVAGLWSTPSGPCRPSVWRWSVPQSAPWLCWAPPRAATLRSTPWPLVPTNGCRRWLTRCPAPTPCLPPPLSRKRRPTRWSPVPGALAAPTSVSPALIPTRGRGTWWSTMACWRLRQTPARARSRLAPTASNAPCLTCWPPAWNLLQDRLWRGSLVSTPRWR